MKVHIVVDWTLPSNQAVLGVFTSAKKAATFVRGWETERRSQGREPRVTIEAKHAA